MTDPLDYGKRVGGKERAPFGVFFIQMLTGEAILFVPGVVILGNQAVTYDGATSFFAWGLALLLVPAFTLSLTALIGLPLRLIPPLLRWWKAHFWLGFIGIAVGVLLIIVAFMLGHRDVGTVDGESYDVLAPDGWLLLYGWVILSFFACHTWLRE